MASLPPQNRTEFDAAADRAREKARSLVTEGLADQAERDRRAEVASGMRLQRGPVAAFLDRVRAALSAIRDG